VLSATDPLPVRPSRIAIAGVSGSGKSTLARRLAALLDLPHVEMDSLFHGPGWTQMPTFEAEVDRFIATGRWVCEWQYDYARPLLTANADLMVWVDIPYPVTFTRVVRRTLRRRIRREELWNGNQEGPLHTFFTDPEHIVRWSFRTRNLYDERMPAVERERPDLPIARLRSTREVEEWISRLAAASAG